VRPLAALAAILLAACSDPPAPPQVPGAVPTVEHQRGADWPSYNRDPAGTRYSPLRQVSATNVDELRQAWSYPLGSAAGAGPEGSELTPLVIDGVLYATAADRVVALRAETGAEIWRFALPQGMPSQRGLAYWRGDAAATARILFTVGRTIVALDAATGQKVPGFGGAGEVTMPSPYAGAPTLFEDFIVVGSNGPPGGVRAYDVRSGAERWRFVGAATLLHPASSLTVDVDRALIYAVFAGPEPDVFYGGGRGATEDPYLNSIVAIDARTGNRRWHFQTVHHDVWDYDLSAPPALLDVAIRGERRPILALAAPAGYLYLLDRVTGAPVFGVVETPVPASDVPGEQVSSTQPVPQKPPPIARVGYTGDDIVVAADTTAAHAAYCRSLRDRGGGLQNLGPFTPYRHRAANREPRSTIVFPGSLGAAGWGGVAVDPERGLVFINTSSEGGIGWLEPNTGDATSAQTGEGARVERMPYRRTSAVGGPLARFWSHDTAVDSSGNERGGSDAWPCQKPPWGELMAVDAAKGEIVWRVPLGITEQLPESKRSTGRLNIGGPIVTAAGLVFVGATNDGRFRAFDARTGAELWVTELPLSAHAVPITYAAADGRQYVAIVAAGRTAIDDAGAADAESLIAYALP
jgi:quinoprotein glucose dehydrogenase